LRPSQIAEEEPFRFGDGLRSGPFAGIGLSHGTVVESAPRTEFNSLWSVLVAPGFPEQVAVHWTFRRRAADFPDHDIVRAAGALGDLPAL